MFNTMTVTKAAAALISSLLFLMLVSWGASALFYVGPSGDGEATQAYTIPVEEADGAAAEAVDEGPDFATIYAEADAGAGEKAFAKCRACHKLDGADGVGPHLNGVVGRTVASADGFNYSGAMAEHGGDWTPEALQEFLANPKGVVKGTKMAFAGIKNIQERANLIAYLESQN